MNFCEINSKGNEIIKNTRELLQAKYRAEKLCFMAEGLRLAEEAVKSCEKIFYCIFTEGFAVSERGSLLLKQADAKGAKLYQVPENLLAYCADTKNPQGIITVQPVLPSFNAKNLRVNPFLLICDAVSDPGNLGTILRLAYAVQADGVILLPDCVEPYNPKVVRSSMGGIFKVPFVKMTHEESKKFIVEYGLQLVLAEADGEVLYWENDFKRPTAVLLGSEVRGVSDFWQQVPAKKVQLPMPGGAESLNVAISAGVFCYEALRQRNL